MRRSGQTLMEVLICTVIFMIFIVLAGSLFVFMVHAYHRGEKAVRPVQSLRSSLALVCSSLRQAHRTPEPDPQTLAAGSDWIVVQCYEPDGTLHTSGFLTRPEWDDKRDKNTKVLVLEEYPTDELGKYDKAEPLSTRPLLRPASRVRFRKLQGDIVVTVELAAPLETQEVALKALVFLRPSSREPEN